jgi:predicted nucleotidyltransferase
MKSPDTIKKDLEAICNRHNLEILYAFGSRAMEIKDFFEGKGRLSSSAPSDADIGVKVRQAPPFSLQEKVRLGMELEDLLDVNRVDLCLLNDADPFLSAEVIRGERIYCKDEFQADEYELYVLRRAGDLAPLERERLSLVLGESR